MTIRQAQRTLGGLFDTRTFEVVTGNGRDGRPLVSIRPGPTLRSGVANVADVAVLDQLIGDLRAVRAHLTGREAIAEQLAQDHERLAAAIQEWATGDEELDWPGDDVLKDPGNCDDLAAFLMDRDVVKEVGR